MWRLHPEACLARHETWVPRSHAFGWGYAGRRQGFGDPPAVPVFTGRADRNQIRGPDMRELEITDE